jgi:hypothetical protein
MQGVSLAELAFPGPEMNPVGDWPGKDTATSKTAQS